MNKPILPSKKIQSGTFENVMGNLEARLKKNKDALARSGGLCINCNKNPAQLGGINSFHCVSCNNKTKEILNQLEKVK